MRFQGQTHDYRLYYTPDSVAAFYSIMGFFVANKFSFFFWPEMGQKWANFRPISSRIWGLVESLTRKTSYLVALLYSDTRVFTLRSVNTSKCKKFFIDFLDELGNFKQKIFYTVSVKVKQRNLS